MFMSIDTSIDLLLCLRTGQLSDDTEERDLEECTCPGKPRPKYGIGENSFTSIVHTIWFVRLSVCLLI